MMKKLFLSLFGLVTISCNSAKRGRARFARLVGETQWQSGHMFQWLWGFWSDWAGLSDLCVRTEGPVADHSVSKKIFQIFFFFFYRSLSEAVILLSNRFPPNCLLLVQEPELKFYCILWGPAMCANWRCSVTAWLWVRTAFNFIWQSQECAQICIEGFADVWDA